MYFSIWVMLARLPANQNQRDVDLRQFENMQMF